MKFVFFIPFLSAPAWAWTPAQLPHDLRPQELTWRQPDTGKIRQTPSAPSSIESYMNELQTQPDPRHIRRSGDLLSDDCMNELWSVPSPSLLRHSDFSSLYKDEERIWRLPSASQKPLMDNSLKALGISVSDHMSWCLPKNNEILEREIYGNTSLFTRIKKQLPDFDCVTNVLSQMDESMDFQPPEVKERDSTSSRTMTSYCVDGMTPSAELHLLKR